MSPNRFNRSPRALVAEALTGVALILPAVAIAAEPSEPEANPDKRTGGGLIERADLALGAGPDRPVLAPVSPLDPIDRAARERRAERQRAERRKRREDRAEARRERRKRAAGPFHPVVGAVGYGSAQAAFGNARGRPHEGQDIFAPAGTPLISPTETVVVEVGSDGGRGNWAALYDPAAKRTYNYFHMIAPAKVAAGQKLGAGDRVGQVGCTGSCTGDHLHFEVRDGKSPYGAARDPLGMLEGWKRWRG